MRLKVTHLPKNKHTQMVTGVGWTPQNNLYSVSDDKTVVRWGLEGTEAGTKVCDVDVYVTKFHWIRSLRAADSDNVFAVGCSDGSFRIVDRNGRVEKVRANAHTGAVTALKWNSEGSTLATAGEDGLLKQWSRSANLRSDRLAEEKGFHKAIYALAWSPDNQSIMYCSHHYITIKSLSANTKPVRWKAHSGTILDVDWNPINNLIISASEDCKYKVFDSYGRSLYQSRAFEFPITSIAWCPNGDYFAIGSFNMMSLCDKTGWVHSRTRTKSGSIMAIDWTSDGTHLAGAGANGAVCFGQIVDRSLEWGRYQITLNENNHIVAHDVLNEDNKGEELEFGDRVIEMSMAYGYLLVATSKACIIHKVESIETAIGSIETKGNVNLILQTNRFILLVDNVKGLQIYTYDAKAVSNPRVPSLHPQYLKSGNVSLSNDCLALIDRANPTQVLLLDVISGKPLADPVSHELEIVHVALNQPGLGADRKIVFIDRNRDLFIAQVHKKANYKLATMVDTVSWNSATDVLAAVSDSKLLVWYYPNVVWVDKDLITATRSSVDASSFGKASQFVSFDDSRCTIRRADGALQTAAISPYPSLLYAYTKQNQWERCTRLCRFVKDEVLWACLAAMALNAEQLDTAEVALAAIDEVDKLQCVQAIKRIPSQEGRTAELFLYRRLPEAGESVLISANLIYRAIMLNVRLFRWPRALDLAIEHKAHVDTVLGHRQNYLASMGRTEDDKRFIQCSSEFPQIDWKLIAAKAEEEDKRERDRGTPYQSLTSAPFAQLESKENKARDD